MRIDTFMYCPKSFHSPKKVLSLPWNRLKKKKKLRHKNIKTLSGQMGF